MRDKTYDTANKGSSEALGSDKYLTGKRRAERGRNPVFPCSWLHIAVWIQVGICEYNSLFAIKALRWVTFSSYLPLTQHTIPTDIPFSSIPAPSAPYFIAHLENPQRIHSHFSWVLFQMLKSKAWHLYCQANNFSWGHLLIPTVSELNGHWQH